MLIVLFALFAGEPAPRDIAIVTSEGACELIAAALNKDPDKPTEIRFGCYARKPRQES